MSDEVSERHSDNIPIINEPIVVNKLLSFSDIDEETLKILLEDSREAFGG